MKTAYKFAPLALLAILLLVPSPSRAEEQPELFSKKPYSWQEEETDRRFLKTRLYKALGGEPMKDPRCARVTGTFLMWFAEAAPYLHKKDQSFYLDEALATALVGNSTHRFPAKDYFIRMIRRTMLDRKAPEEWLATAKTLKAKHKAPIDVGKLAYAVDGPQLVDSLYFNVPTLFDRFVKEVFLAPTVAQASALDRFNDRYIDRDVAWGGLILADIHKWEPPPPEPPKKTRKGAKEPPPPKLDPDDEEQKPHYIATLIVPSPPPAPSILPEPVKPASVHVSLRLLPEQYVDVRSAIVTHKYVIHGRLFGFKPGDQEPGSPQITIDVRDGMLFDDRDWSGYQGFASPEDFAGCELCINDLSPLGMKEKQGVGERDGFSH